MDELFQAQKDSPPLHKNHPPVAGAIFWERSLFHRIKHTIVRFLTMEDMMQSEMGKHVSNILYSKIMAISSKAFYLHIR